VRGTCTMAFSCLEGVNTRDTDPCLMRRSVVQPDESAVGLSYRVRAGRYPVDRWRARLRVRSRLLRLRRALVRA
jgi:hypothetical protein